MVKTFIRNRKHQKLAVLVEQATPSAGLVFIMHGLGGFKEQPHIRLMADTFHAKGFTVVTFDTTNTLGESSGSYQYATVTNYYNDLEDVIQWARAQSWYREPFTLAAHNMGGMCVGLYAAKYPERVAALAPISPLISGPLSLQALQRRENIDAWRATGWQVRESRSRPGIVKRLKWAHIEDRLKYDLLPHASRLTMPVLMVVGEKDTITPPEHLRLLYNLLPGPKELRVVKGAYHRFRDEITMKLLREILEEWIGRIPVARYSEPVRAETTKTIGIGA